MPLIETVNTTAECLRTDCNILGDIKKRTYRGTKVMKLTLRTAVRHVFIFIHNTLENSENRRSSTL